MDDVSVFITSDETSSERRVSLGWSISHLKSRLETITGIPSTSQELAIFAASTTLNPVVLRVSCVKEDDPKLLQSFGLHSGGRIQVNDLRPVSERLSFDSLSTVEKYELTKEEYEQRDKSVLAWKKQNKLGRFNPDLDEKQSKIEAASREHVKSKGIQIGKRCTANGRKGTVKFVGEVPQIPSKVAPHQLWVGIEFDEPVGKNDGSINGVRYFESSPANGSFIKPELVEIGDFKRDSYEDDEDDDDEL